MQGIEGPTVVRLSRAPFISIPTTGSPRDIFWSFPNLNFSPPPLLRISQIPVLLLVCPNCLTLNINPKRFLPLVLIEILTFFFLRMVSSEITALRDQPHIQNLSQTHQLALAQLKTLEEVVIKEADKGGCVLVPDEDHYKRMSWKLTERYLVSAYRICGGWQIYGGFLYVGGWSFSWWINTYTIPPSTNILLPPQDPQIWLSEREADHIRIRQPNRGR